MLRTLIVGTAVTLIAAAAAAQVPEREMLDCASVVGAEERLGCYDALAAGIDAEAQRTVSARRAEEAERARRLAEEERRQAEERAQAEAAATAQTAESAFGREDFEPGTGKPARDLKSIEASVARTEDDRLGRKIVLLENGQVWRQRDSGYAPVREGQSVEIERGFGNSYKMKGSGRAFAVVRIR